MKVKIFAIPVTGDEMINNDMNEFLSTHRILDVREELADGKYWTFCIRYLTDGKESGEPLKMKSERTKIDYREKLSVEEFARFAEMRDIRKDISDSRKVPPYVIFTDAELALLCQEDPLTLDKAKKIKGIGKGHIEYVEEIIKRMSEHTTDETV